MMCFSDDWRCRFTRVNNFCLLELIEVALGHLDELQKAEKYPIRWSLQTGFTVVWLLSRFDPLVLITGQFDKNDLNFENSISGGNKF